MLPDLSGGDPVSLGHLIVEPRRHVPGLAGLTPDDAAKRGGNAEVTQLLSELRARLDVPGADR